VKYRRKVLTPEIEEYLKKILAEIAEENEFSVDQCEVGEADHVHCFVTAPPKLSITFIVKHLKGTSGIRLFRMYPELRSKLWKGQLWNGSYFVETIGSASEENIKHYIAHQENVQR
jgi:putative transposase